MYKYIFIALLFILPSLSYALDIPEFIALTATEYGINPQTALYISYKESNWDPKAVGDHGTSFGLFQIHNPKQKGLTVAQAEDVYFSTVWAMKTMKYDGGCKQWSTCPTPTVDL